MRKKLIPKLSLISITICTVLGANSFALAAAKYENYSWVSPNNWEGAVFDVPTWFAKDMQYSGREVIRFHDGFYDAQSTGYWTYAFTLLIEQTNMPSIKDLKEETKRYFVGLVRDLGKHNISNYLADNIVVTKMSDWITTKNNQKRSQIFLLKSYDSFTTGKPINLNVKITTWLCSNQHRAIHYAISPHEIGHPIWAELNMEIDALKCW